MQDVYSSFDKNDRVLKIGTTHIVLEDIKIMFICDNTQNDIGSHEDYYLYNWKDISLRIVMKPNNGYKRIVENSPLGIMYLDRSGTISLCNDKISNILNIEKKDIVGFNISDVFTNEDVQNIIETALSENNIHYQWEFQPPEKDKTINLEIHCNPDFSEHGILEGVICILEDISSKIQIKENLKLDESRLEALLKLYEMSSMSFKEIARFVQEEAVRLTQSKMGYLAFLEEGNMLRMHSWSHDAMKVCAVENRTFKYPLETTGIWGEAIRQRKPIITNDFQAPNPLKKGYPKGHIKISRHMNVPIYDDDEIVGVAGVGNKESDYDKSDVRQMTLLMEGMWQIIQRKRASDALKEYAEELKKTNEMKDLFTDILRHDLLNPAGVIQGYTEMLIDTEENEKRRELLKAIEISNKKLIEIIKNAASFAKLDTIDKLEFQHIDIALMLSEIVESFKLQICEKQMNVEGIPDTEYMANANPMMEEVLVNLFSNAIKYSPDNEKVLIDILDSDDEWKISFTDFGTGVKDEDKTKLFERFKRVDKSGIKGTGLGLAIAKMITELHGGNIGVEDNPAGKGSIFWVTVKKA